MDSINRTEEAVKSSLRGPKNALLTIFFSISFLGLMLLGTDIYWHLDTISQGRVIDAYLNASSSIKMKGAFNFPVTLVYAGLGGITLTNFVAQIKTVGIRKEGLSILPGFVAAGCASCGVGIASIVGLGAATAALPFEGLGIKIGGIMLMLYALNRLENSKTCSIPSS